MTKAKKGKSFVAIIVFIAIIALLLRIAIVQTIAITASSNESHASSTLKLIAAALEKYAEDNKGVFPGNFSLLLKTSPAYLETDYISESPIKGYNYSCLRIDPTGYSCSVLPLKCGLTGKAVFTITTGGVLVAESCKAKD